jgi:hypothetical protein
LLILVTITLPSCIIARLSGQLVARSFPDGRERIGSSRSPNYKRTTAFRYDLISRTIVTRQIRRTVLLAGATVSQLNARAAVDDHD